MWRVGAVLILAAAFAEGSFADFDDGHHLQRHKRHMPGCPPHCWQPGFPPPPHYWQPPPPPEWYRYQQPKYNQAYFKPQGVLEHSRETNDNRGKFEGQGEPCKTCGENSAVSNAESDTGSAIALAIARPKADP